jgi:hypothetical protein
MFEFAWILYRTCVVTYAYTHGSWKVTGDSAFLGETGTTLLLGFSGPRHVPKSMTFSLCCKGCAHFRHMGKLALINIEEMDSWECPSRSGKIKSMNDTELKILSAQVKNLAARVEALERLLQRIIQQKPVSERQLERSLRNWGAFRENSVR